MGFEIPYIIKDPSQSFNKALLTGYICKNAKKDGTAYDFACKFKKKSGNGYYDQFNAILDAGNNNIIALKGFNGGKSPNRVKELANSVTEGMYVDIIGRFTEYYSEDKGIFYRNINVLEIKEVGEDKPSRAEIILQGEVQEVYYEDGLQLVLGLKKYNSNDLDIFCIVGDESNDYVQWMKANIVAGDTVNVTCKLVIEYGEDEFGDKVEKSNYVELIKLSGYAKK